MFLQAKSSNKFLPSIIIILGLLFSVLSGFFTYHYYEQKEHIQSEIIKNEILILIKNRMAAYEQVLKSGIGLFKASNSISRDNWAIFIKEHKLDDNFKGIQGVGYSEVVLPSNKIQYEERIRKEGFPDFKIYPVGERDLYTSIIYLEPFDARNRKAFGYDMFSEKVRREAMTEAMQSGQATLSGKIKLVQEGDKDIQAGFLMYLPVYKKGSNLDSIQDRTSAIQVATLKPT